MSLELIQFLHDFLLQSFVVPVHEAGNMLFVAEEVCLCKKGLGFVVERSFGIKGECEKLEAGDVLLRDDPVRAVLVEVVHLLLVKHPSGALRTRRVETVVQFSGRYSACH